MTRKPMQTTMLTPEDWTDRELLGRMLVREGKAWREFHRRFDRLIYRCIHKVTGRFRSVVSSEDVREIYCQLLMNLTARNMHKLQSFQPERGNKLSSWIGLLATNTAWDYLRSVARQPQCTDLTAAEEVHIGVRALHDMEIGQPRHGEEVGTGPLRATGPRLRPAQQSRTRAGVRGEPAVLAEDEPGTGERGLGPVPLAPAVRRGVGRRPLGGGVPGTGPHGVTRPFR